MNLAGNAKALIPHRFQKGISGNPAGRPRVPDHLKSIHSFSQPEVVKIISKYGRMTLKELLEEVDNEATPMMDRIIAKMFKESLKNADYMSLNFLLDRSIGRVAAVINSDEDSERSRLSSLPLQELLQLVRNAIPEIKEVIARPIGEISIESEQNVENLL